MNKNKIFLLLIIIIISTVGLIYFLSTNNNNTKENNFESVVNTSTWNIVFDEIWDDLTDLREEISLNDVVKLYTFWNLESNNILIKNTKNLIDQINSKQKYKVTQNFNWGITLEEAREIFKTINPKLVRELKLQLDILDDKNNPITDSGDIYVNNINIWKIVDWKFSWVFPWIIWTEYFNVLVRSKNFNDGFLTLNALNSNWGVLYSQVNLKKAEFKEIDLSKDNNITFNDYSITIPRCTFSKNGSCFEEKVMLKSSFFSDDEVNNYMYSLNMRAIDDKWEVVELVSWWMAFNEFYSWDEILTINPDQKVEINYNIWEKQIKNMDQNQVLNWYWHYSKDLWIWKFLPWEWMLDINKKTFNIKTNTIY